MLEKDIEWLQKTLGMQPKYEIGNHVYYVTQKNCDVVKILEVEQDEKGNYIYLVKNRNDIVKIKQENLYSSIPENLSIKAYQYKNANETCKKIFDDMIANGEW